MDEAASPTPRPRMDWRRETAALFRGAWDVWRTRWKGGLLGLGVLVILLAVLVPRDEAILVSIQQPEDTVAHEAARQVSFWGDFVTGTLPLVAAMLVLGLAMRRVRWQQAGLAVLLAAIVAGILVNIVRPGVGRPRPSADLPDGVYAFELRYDYHGFPSAHTSNAFATATALAVIAPPVGVPALIGAGAIGWSRIQLDRHHLTDVIAGAFLGVAIGGAFGLTASRRAPCLRVATEAALTTDETPAAPPS